MAINKIFAGLPTYVPGGIPTTYPNYITSYSDSIPIDTAQILVATLYALNNTFHVYSYLEATAIRNISTPEDQRVLRVMFKRRRGAETRD